MRIIFIIVCCFLCNQLKAQQAKLSHEDSIEIERILNEPKVGYVFADESGYSFSEYDFERANKRVSYLTDSNRFSWPHRMHSRPQTPTYDYLLEHKYYITFEDIGPGCMEELWFTLHDSLMDVEIVKKYGHDFYRNTYAEVLLLDKGGRGLNLPFIKHSENTGMAIKRALSFLDTVNFSVDGGSARIGKCIRIKFKGNKVDDIDLGFYTMLFIEVEESAYLKKDIIKKLNSLKWKGASFNNKLIDAVVVYGFDENKMRFWFND